MPAILVVAGIGIEVSTWALQSARMQRMVDSAAVAGSIRYNNGGTVSQAANAAADVAEINGATGATNRTWSSTTSTLTDGSIAVSVLPSTTTSGHMTVSVTVTNTVNSAASALVPGGAGSRTIVRTASADAWTSSSTIAATSPCVMSLDTSSAKAIWVDNQGSVVGPNCGVFANSNSSTAIYLDSGKINASSVGTAGAIAMSSSSSNNLNPSPGTTGAAVMADPYSKLVMPSFGACSYANGNFSAGGTTYSFTQSANVFCGNTTFGGNGASVSFDPGVYFVINGNLVFNNVVLNKANGVTFIVTGSSPGGIQWINNSQSTAQFTPPTSGPTANLSFWQTCGSSGTPGADVINGNSTLILSGTYYAPCGALTISNNAKLNTLPVGADVVVKTLYVTGNSQLNAKPGVKTITTANSKLVQ